MHRRCDLDLMLAAWGMHHLHLSSDIEEKGFAVVDQARTAPAG